MNSLNKSRWREPATRPVGPTRRVDEGNPYDEKGAEKLQKDPRNWGKKEKEKVKKNRRDVYEVFLVTRDYMAASFWVNPVSHPIPTN